MRIPQVNDAIKWSNGQAPGQVLEQAWARFEEARFRWAACERRMRDLLDQVVLAEQDQAHELTTLQASLEWLETCIGHPLALGGLPRCGACKRVHAGRCLESVLRLPFVIRLRVALDSGLLTVVEAEDVMREVAQ